MNHANAAKQNVLADGNRYTRTTMKHLHSFKLRLRAGIGVAVIVTVIYAVSGALVIGADTTSAGAKAADKKPQKKEAKKLTGSELYAINCNRCHAERYPTEFNSAQWKTLMTHMRVRANLPEAGQGNPEISAGRQRRLTLHETEHENSTSNSWRAGCKFRDRRGSSSACVRRHQRRAIQPVERPRHSAGPDPEETGSAD
jgi:hypothetical protein